MARINRSDTEGVVQDVEAIACQTFIPAKAVQIAHAVMPAQNEIAADQFMGSFVVERDRIRRMSRRRNRLPVRKSNSAQQSACMSI